MGQFLRVLSGLKPGARFAEIGTGLGVGSAWILSGMDSESTLITVDKNEGHVSAVREMFSDLKNFEVVHGDWKQIIERGPFDFVFVDAKPAKTSEFELLISCVNHQGVIVLDDFTPTEFWPEQWQGKPDLVREKWFHDARLLCTEVRTSARNSVLIARRI